LSRELKTSWERCVPHATHAITRHAFGIEETLAQSRNKEVTQLVSQCKTVIYTVNHIEQAGSLFKELCEQYGTPNLSLSAFSTHRFLGVTKTFKRILALWLPLTHFYCSVRGAF